MAAVWSITTQQARQKTDALLDYAIIDFKDTANGAVQAILDAKAQTLTRRFKTPDLADEASLSHWKESFGVDDVLIRRGIVREASPAERRDATLAFRTATEYFPPPHDDSYVEVSLSEKTLAKSYAAILGHFFDDWLVGEEGFFLCAEMPSGKLISNPRRHRNESSTLAGTGFVEPDSPPGDETFTQELFGETTYCRMFDYAGHRVLACVPESEFYTMRNVLVAVIGILVFLVLAGFSAFADRVSEQSRKLKEFYAAEFELARTIQTSALPAQLPLSDHFRLAAGMTSAREVGGDFYDFFALSETRWAFLVADVSGKGITAALYMMTAKTILKDALLAEHDVAAAVARTNRELCRNNPANMFVTVWVGVIDLATGRISCVNAGHNPPALIRANGETEFIRTRSGAILGFMEDAAFKPFDLHLSGGDKLFLYTDGVVEQFDTRNEAFGEDRLAEVLRSARGEDPATLNNVVRMAVSAFAAGASVADDITVMTFAFDAPVIMPVSRRFATKMDSIPLAAKFLEETVGKASGPEVAVVLDEIASNIVRHSKGTYFELSIMVSHDSKRLVFRDDGIAFDPLSIPAPDVHAPLQERKIGGLGIMMVRHLTRSIKYSRENGENVLTIEF